MAFTELPIPTIALSALPAKQLPNHGVNTHDVSKLATGGAGTYASPWTGWVALLAPLFAPDSTYFFPSGVYAHDGSLNFGQYAHCRYLGEGGTILKYTGSAGGTVMDFTSTHATTNVDGEFGEHEATYGLTVENFILDGNGLADVGMFLHSIHHSNFKNIYARNVVDKKFFFQFTICNVYDNLRATRRVGDPGSEDPETTACVNGIYLDNEPGAPINTVQGCIFINLVIEFTTGIGLYCGTGCKENDFRGGAVQVSALENIKVQGDGNTFKMAAEFGSAGIDWIITGNRNILDNAYGTGTTYIGNDTDGATPTGNEVRGGAFNSLDIQTDCDNTLVMKPGIQFLDGTGQFRNRSNNTIILGSPFIYSSGVKIGSDFVLPGYAVSKGNSLFTPGYSPVIHSPDGTAYKLAVANGGALSTTAFTEDSVLARSDDFTDNSIGSQWYKGTFATGYNAAVTVVESSAQLNITLLNTTAGNNYNGLVGPPRDMLDGGIERIKAVSRPASGSYAQRFAIGKSGRDCILMYTDGTNMIMGFFSGGSFGSSGSVAFNAVNHLYWRMRRSTSDVVGEVSADGTSWTTLGTVAAVNVPFAFTNYRVCIEAGSTGSSTFSAAVVFDDYIYLRI